MPPTTKTNGQAVHPLPAQNSENSVPTVNRKKQKRRQKAAEKLAAELAAGKSANVNGTRSPGKSVQQSQLAAAQQKAYQEYKNKTSYINGPIDPDQYSDEEADTNSDFEHSGSPPNGHNAQSPTSRTKSGKRKDNGKTAQSSQIDNASAPSNPAPLRMSKEKIWNTSSQEERERIKVFWLSLGEEERRSLVKVEKDAVLKKMKEQQKHSCSCTVCGRKRIAIEEELEVLYDAYYEELEQYANNQQGDRPPPMMAGSSRFGALSGLAPPNRLPIGLSGRRGRIVEHFDAEDEEDEDGEEYDSEDDAEDDDYLTDDDQLEDPIRSHATDFFNFGQSLTVQGGILTVADDLLKNDGKKFIEMMEQLAERRMAREEDARDAYSPNGYPHPNGLPSHSHHSHHNHPPPPEEDDDEYDDEEEDDGEGYNSEDEYEDEEMDTMTEEQRMEEGRRMFQIFAARMFEQRVLTAYKEKVAAERQEKLLQELIEEDEAAIKKKEKKAKEAQKKKEKAQQKKLALAEEKAKRDAEKAAEEAKRLAEEAKKAEEARARAEEKRKRREAQKKAEEEERQRKEAEKQRRQQEQRERQAEQERKAREAKEREKREKEEARQREREAKEAREREAKEKRERLERERKDAESKAAQDAARRRANSQSKRASVPAPTPLRPLHQLLAEGAQAAQAALPALPKAPTPSFRPNMPSQRDAASIPQTPQFGSIHSQSASPNPSTPQHESPSLQAAAGRTASQPFLHQPQATSPLHSTLKTPFAALQAAALYQSQGANSGLNGHSGFPPIGAGFPGRLQPEPLFQHQPQPFGSQFRPLPGPSSSSLFSSLSGMPIPQGRGFPGQHGPPPGFPAMPTGQGGLPPGFGMHRESAPALLHTRHNSGSLDKPVTEPIGTPSQRFARPTPIGRPKSRTRNKTDGDVDDLAGHLGSSALLDDTDEPIMPMNLRRASAAPGSLGRHSGFGMQPSMGFGMDPSAFSSSPGGFGNTWAPPPNPFATGSLPGPGYIGGWSSAIPPPSPFASHSIPIRQSAIPHSVGVRLMLCRACRSLEGHSADNFHSLASVREQVARYKGPLENPVSDKEILDLCETEGNATNGGGFFDVKYDADGQPLIRYEPVDSMTMRGPAGVPGDIGSPIVGSANVTPLSSRFPSGPPGIPGPFEQLVGRGSIA